MKIRYYSKLNNDMIMAGLRRLLIRCDREFVPPLSARSSTTQSNLNQEGGADRIPEEYFQAVAS